MSFLPETHWIIWLCLPGLPIVFLYQVSTARIPCVSTIRDTKSEEKGRTRQRYQCLSQQGYASSGAPKISGEPKAILKFPHRNNNNRKIDEFFLIKKHQKKTCLQRQRRQRQRQKQNAPEIPKWNRRLKTIHFTSFMSVSLNKIHNQRWPSDGYVRMD